MRELRRHRNGLSSWLIALLLLMQGITAAYACPKLEVSAQAGRDAAMTAMAEMPGCTGGMLAMDTEQPQLCKAHCDAARQSVNSAAGVLDAPVVMAHGPALARVLDVHDAAQLAAAMPPALAAGPPSGALPLYLALLVLRN